MTTRDPLDEIRDNLTYAHLEVVLRAMNCGDLSDKDIELLDEVFSYFERTLH
jgi:hypothetical protein